MTRVVINGVGKLGQAVIAASQDPGAAGNVVVVAGVDAAWSKVSRGVEVPVVKSLDAVPDDFDVIVDCSRAEGVDGVLEFALENEKAVVIAATGHSEEQLARIEKAARKIPVLHSSNLSLGVNVLRRLVEDAGAMLGPVDAEIVETHHRMKVDAPSGTALTLAEALRDATGGDRKLVYGRSPEDHGARGKEIGIHAVRGGTVVGEHTVTFLLDDEIVELRHVAQSRGVFGYGALRASAFVAAQEPGLYSMADLLG